MSLEFQKVNCSWSKSKLTWTSALVAEHASTCAQLAYMNLKTAKHPQLMLMNALFAELVKPNVQKTPLRSLSKKRQATHLN